MPWHLLHPLTPEDCRFRGPAEPVASGEVASCGLVRAALPDGREGSDLVPRAACLACCRQAPATPEAWNPVVAALVYRAAADRIRASEGADPPARLSETRARAMAGLDRIDADPDPRIIRRPVRPFETLRELIPPHTTRLPERIRRWAVGVTTAPRPRPTLEACLDALGRAGWPSPHLFIDSAVRVPARFGHLPGTLRSPAAGAWPNHYLSLFELTLRHPDADAYLIVQDDALLYSGEDIRSYLEDSLWPGGRFPLVSLYCPQPYTAERYGWHRRRSAWVWGALAFVFPRAVARRYLRDRAVCEHRWGSRGGGMSQVDVLLGRWARRRRIPVWFPTPSLVQHVGRTSTLSAESRADGPRVAGLFAGDRASEPPVTLPSPRQE